MAKRQSFRERQVYGLGDGGAASGLAPEAVLPFWLEAFNRHGRIHLSLEASQRLDIHATMMNLDRSALVEKLISEHLRRYVVSDRGGAETSAEATASSP